MAIAALEPGMTSFKEKARSPVIEFLRGGIPVDEIETAAVVIGVAGSACASGPVVSDERRMQPTALVKSASDITMAVQAFVLRRPLPDVMAIGTVRRTAQEAVGRRQGAGRKLGENRSAA
jgi:hypothetical protein